MKFTIKYSLLFACLLASVNLFAVGPIANMSAIQIDNVEEKVGQAINTFQSSCASDNASAYPLMGISFTTAPITINNSSTTLSPFAVSATSWAGGLSCSSPDGCSISDGAFSFSGGSATITSGTITLNEAYVTTVNISYGGVTCPSPSTTNPCSSQLATMNAEIISAWSAWVVIPNATATASCSEVGGVTAGSGTLTDGDYVIVDLPSPAPLRNYKSF
jgi:hypothetical protein